MTRGICLATNLFKMHSCLSSSQIWSVLHTEIIGSPKVKTELSFHKCKILLHFDMIQRSVRIESWTFANTMTNQNFMEFPHNTVGLKYGKKVQFRDKVGFYLPQRFGAQSRTSNRKAWFRYPASLVRRFWEM